MMSFRIIFVCFVVCFIVYFVVDAAFVRIKPMMMMMIAAPRLAICRCLPCLYSLSVSCCRSRCFAGNRRQSVRSGLVGVLSGHVVRIQYSPSHALASDIQGYSVRKIEYCLHSLYKYSVHLKLCSGWPPEIYFTSFRKFDKSLNNDYLLLYCKSNFT